MPTPSKAPSFTLVIWLLVLAAVLYLLCWPVLESFWAARTWDKTPCGLLPERGEYIFSYDNQKYVSTRMDFWDRQTVNAFRDSSDITPPIFDQFCYVKHNDPTWAVKNVDALNHLDHAGHGAIVAVFVIIAGGLLSWASRKFAPRPVEPPANVQ